MTTSDDGNVAIWSAALAGIKKLIDMQVKRDFTTAESMICATNGDNSLPDASGGNGCMLARLVVQKSAWRRSIRLPRSGLGTTLGVYVWTQSVQSNLSRMI